MQHTGITQIHWDIAKLLEMGVDEQIIQELSEQGIKDLLKGLLYLEERYRDRH